MIVDCHTHWGMCYTDRDGDNPASWLGLLDRNGIGAAFVFGHYNLTRSDLCPTDNDRLARLRERSKGRMIPFGTAWPQMGGQAVAEARRCLENLGFAGLKFHPWMQGFSTADPVLAEMCLLAGEMGKPVIFHDGTPCYSLPEQIAGLAKRFPSTRFVLGHSGILYNWRSALAAGNLPNIWLCLCGPHPRAMEVLFDRLGASRLLWGSDFGFGFSDPIAYRLGLLTQSRIPPAARRQILKKNPLELLSHA